MPYKQDDNANKCDLCGRTKNEWDGEGISVGSYNYCGEQCRRTAMTGKRDPRAPERAINEVEKYDAYNDNDMQPPFDEAPVKAGGSIPDQDR
jgi:hypothetical protein